MHGNWRSNVIYVPMHSAQQVKPST